MQIYKHRYFEMTKAAAHMQSVILLIHQMHDNCWRKMHHNEHYKTILIYNITLTIHNFYS